MEIRDPLFKNAVDAIDRGDMPDLKKILTEYPELVSKRLESGDEGYFKDPYLLWFIAENPVRNNTLPKNIVDIARFIIDFAEQQNINTLPGQIDYTLTLVCSGRVPREQRVQAGLIDLLVDRGASADGSLMPALIHKEVEAVDRLRHHHAKTTLPVAIALGEKEIIQKLLPTATKAELQIALTAAAYYGQAEAIKSILQFNVDVNAWNPKGFHDHSTPLHQAVWCGAVDAVKALLDGGADIRIKDKIHDGTPLTWANYCNQFAAADYLREYIATAIVNELMTQGTVAAEHKKQTIQTIASKLKELDG
jgi:hypothetical protein